MTGTWSSKEEIYIWRAENYTMRLLENSPLCRCNISGFIDKDPNKCGMRILDKAVLGTAIMKEMPEEVTIVVCSAIYSGEILKEIENMHVKNKIVVLK